MGMDLLAVRPTGRSPRSFAVNLPTWWLLRSLVLRLGCDIREMSDMNDGGRIQTAPYRQWAGALRAALPALHIVNKTLPLGVHARPRSSKDSDTSWKDRKRCG